MTPDTHRIRAVGFVVVALLVLGACGSGNSSDATSTPPATDAPTSTSTGDTVRLLAPAEFQQFMTEHPDAPVVNVHIPYERHIAGTDAFVPFDEIAQWDALPADLDAPIVLYCRSGNMSAEAATTLTGLGYTDIVDLEGGMNAWAAAGLPLLDQDPAAG